MSYDQLAQLLWSKDAAPRLAWGVVTADNGDTMTVTSAGQEMTAVRCCNASVGDVVALEIAGQVRAIATKGGETQRTTASVTKAPGWTGTYLCTKVAGVVSLQFGAVYATAATTMGNTAYGQNQIATLPEGFRPSRNLYGYCGGNSTSRHAMIYIKTTGEVYLDFPNSTTAPTSGGFAGSITFIVGG